MSYALLLSVFFYDGRYHGVGDWPPSPARLFQALVAGATRGATFADEDRTALEWLERLDPPIVATPAARRGRDQPCKNYVPNNDLDAVGGDPRRIGEIRTATKVTHPYLFDATIPLLFIWTFGGGVQDETHPRTVCKIAERLYQLGRGVDMAWAWGELLDTSEVEARLTRHEGSVHRPSEGNVGKSLPCPQKGSFASLKKRFAAGRSRFTQIQEGRKTQVTFSQAPKPRFAKVMYNARPQHFLFELRTLTSDESFVSWSATRVTELVTAIRDKAAERLKEALPGEAGKIDRVLIGRGATEADKAARVRILALPSIGHTHADHAIRRVRVEIPPNCPLRTDDVVWAFSGLEVMAPTTRETSGSLVRSEDHGMLNHYGIGDSEQKEYCVWRTVTPAALPVMRPGHGTTGAKLAASELKAAHAVAQALRHTGVSERVASIRVQREPFDRNGSRAEAFAVPKRFAANGLYHVEICFAQAVQGPLVIGNGRYLGLGLMAPKKDASHDVLVFSMKPETRISTADTIPLLHAVRRALMALASKENRGRVPRLFSGHEPDGTPASSGRHEHIFLAADDTDGDGRIDRLIVAAPWVCDRTIQGDDREHADFNRVVPNLTSVRAGKLGVISLDSAYVLPLGDPLVGPVHMWESRTLYHPTRHAGRGKDMEMAIVSDIIAECHRRGLPRPRVEVLELHVGPKGGNLAARMSLRFTVAVKGPILLGRNSHKGGGLFVAVNHKL